MHKKLFKKKSTSIYHKIQLNSERSINQNKDKKTLHIVNRKKNIVHSGCKNNERSINQKDQ